MKKIASIFLALSLVFLALAVLSPDAGAVGTWVRDGLKVGITTDKTEYAPKEDIKISVSLENGNDHAMKILSLEIILPDGMSADKGDLVVSGFNLEAGKDYSASVVAHAETAGFDMGTVQLIAIAVAVIVLVLVIILVAKRKKAARAVSVCLCIAMLLTVMPLRAMAADTKTVEIILDKPITVGDKDYNIQARCTYELVDLNRTVTFETNGGSEIPSQTLLVGETPEIPASPVKVGHTLVGWYADSNFTQAFDFSAPVNEDCTVYARWVNTADTTDTDGDGLTDPIEEFYGTNPGLPDTDSDGLSDYIEIAVLSYNPLSKDTDSDGTQDALEDFDNDGINNADEVALGTDPSLADTDGDGLDDMSEIYQHQTDPVNRDTDADGASDGKEVELGTDPRMPEMSFYLNVSPEDTNDIVVPSVEIELSGEQVETLRIDAVADQNFFPETIPGYMGKAYDFSVDGYFSSARISFAFDMSLLNADSDPVICYFNEETQELEPLPTFIDGNVASATVTHFSRYILIDRTIYDNSFVWTDVWDSTKNYTDVEIVLVIDDSGSLGGDYGYNSSLGIFTGGKDPEHMRLEVSRNFVDSANANARIGIIKFDGVVDNLTGQLISCDQEGKATLKNYLQFTYNPNGDYDAHGLFDSRGYTYMYSGIKEAMNQFTENADTTMKVVIVFTDGQAQDTTSHNSVVNTALNKDVKIYTVGLGTTSEYFNNYLKPLASNTGGAFYMASDADQLADIYKNISQKIDIETDSDGDGIPDYYEDNMICFNGVKLTLDKNNPDTDGDGIKDGEEVVLKYEYNADRTQVKVTGRIVLGNPANPDSDGDGYSDKEDKTPFSWNISDRDLVMCSSMSYSFIPKTSSLNNLSVSLKQEIENRFDGTATWQELGKWSVVDTWYAGGGLQAIAFKIDSNIVVAYRGTDEGVDWFNDGTTYVLGISTHTAGAKKFMKKVMETYKGYNFYVTGHSLGGHLAYNAAAAGIDYSKSSIKGVVTFNGLGLTLGLTLFGDLWDEAQLMKKTEVIRNYSVEKDPVSKGFLGFTTFHYGTTYTYAISPEAPDAHSLYTFLEQLDPTARCDYYQ